MSCGRKRHKGKRKDKFHIVPKCRGGTRTIKMCRGCHFEYHQMFDEKTPDEIIDYLVNYYWDGNIQWVVKYMSDKKYITRAPFN